jgi:hypothetical protein
MPAAGETWMVPPVDDPISLRPWAGRIVAWRHPESMVVRLPSQRRTALRNRVFRI